MIGPWIVGGGWLVYDQRSGDIVADVGFGSDEEWKARANLIAAAPDILAVLTGLVQANEQWNESVEAVVGRPVNWSDSYLDNARAAIAKANGS